MIDLFLQEGGQDTFLGKAIQSTLFILSLHRQDLDARFPGLLDTILQAHEASSQETSQEKPLPFAERKAHTYPSHSS